ncbi:ATP-binding protein [Streptomyces sp. NPDC055078]
MHIFATQLPLTVRVFRRRLPATRLGARLARQLTVGTLRRWEIPPGVMDRAEVVAAELAANAVMHGQVRGRGFRLRLAFEPPPAGCGWRSPTPGERAAVPPEEASPEGESGRGLLLADRWGTEPYPPSGKTVWAEIDTGTR